MKDGKSKIYLLSIYRLLFYMFPVLCVKGKWFYVFQIFQSYFLLSEFREYVKICTFKTIL